MSTAPPPGFTVRAASLDDAATITEVMAASAREVVGDDDVTVDEVLGELRRPRIDLARDTFLAFDVQGRAVGYAEAVDDHEEQAFIDVYLAPHLPDPQYRQLGAWLTAACLARCDEFLRATGRTAVPVSTGCYRNETRLGQVLADAGLVPVRVFWRMSIELDEQHLDPPPWPVGVVIRPLDVEDLGDSALAHRLVDVSFREHFGAVEESYEAFWERARRTANFDPSLWWLAEVDAEPAAVLIGDNRRVGEGCGWIRTLGVLPEHRGRGAAKALLLHAFAEFGRRGLTSAMLGVDAENTTGATALYERVGMSPAMVIDSYATTRPD